MSRVILGIDPSSKSAAIVTHYPINGGVVAKKLVFGKTKYDPSVSARAYEDVITFLDDLPILGPERYAFLEAPVVGRGGIRSTMVQAFTSGAIQAALGAAGFQVYLVNNSTWKKAVVGSGAADKPAVGRIVQAVFPKAWALVRDDGDLIDAAALAYYGTAVVRNAAVVGRPGRL